MLQYLPLPMKSYSKQEIYRIANYLEYLYGCYRQIAKQETDLKNEAYGFIATKDLSREFKDYIKDKDNNLASTIQDRLNLAITNKLRKEN